jgi:dienelactone hydrolase
VFRTGGTIRCMACSGIGVRLTRRLGIIAPGMCAVLLAGVTACGTSASGPGAVLRATPPTGRYDTPLSITVTGLTPKTSVTLKATTMGVGGNTFQSAASFVSDGSGDLDLATAAPRSGSYVGAHSQGLLWSLQCGKCTYSLTPPPGGYRVTLTVAVDNTVLATTQVTRLLSDPGVSRVEERPSNSGIYGDFFSGPNRSRRQPAALLFGGSNGGLDGLDPEGSLLASDGYPTLVLAYFAEPGLPQALLNIPLEYFVHALTWLSRQPGVDPSRIVVQGASRGSEAALLLGVHFSQLVHGVIALVPNDAALCASPSCGGPAWTLGGSPVPYTSEFNVVAPTDVPNAVIPVEEIKGPVLLDCGGHDQVWNSCGFAEAIQARLVNFPLSHTLLGYPNGDHDVGFPLPYFPVGDNSEPDALARIDQWPHLVDFLGRV